MGWRGGEGGLVVGMKRRGGMVGEGLVVGMERRGGRVGGGRRLGWRGGASGGEGLIGEEGEVYVREVWLM